MKFTSQNNARLLNQNRLEEIRQYIRMAIDCTQTETSYPYDSCNEGTLIELKRRQVNGMTGTPPPLIVVPATGTITKIGHFCLRASCTREIINLSDGPPGGIRKKYAIEVSENCSGSWEELRFYAIPFCGN